MKKALFLLITLISFYGSFAQTAAQDRRTNPLCYNNRWGRPWETYSSPELLRLDSFIMNGGLLVRSSAADTVSGCDCVYLPAMKNKLDTIKKKLDSIVVNTGSTATSTGIILTNSGSTAVYTGSTAVNTGTTAVNTGTTADKTTILVNYETSVISSVTLANAASTNIPANSILIGGITNNAASTKLIATNFSGQYSIENALIQNAIPSNVHLQSFKNYVISSHIVTCLSATGCIFFIAALN